MDAAARRVPVNFLLHKTRRDGNQEIRRWKDNGDVGPDICGPWDRFVQVQRGLGQGSAVSTAIAIQFSLVRYMVISACIPDMDDLDRLQT